MIPEGYEKLAVIGIAWKDEYVQGTAYKTMNGVYYQGSTYVALRDNPTGPPVADGANWQYLAKGFVAALLNMIEATDTSGVLGTAGAQVGAQDLMDAIADRVMTKLVAKNQIVNNLLATAPGNVLDATQGKALKDDVTKLYSDLAKKIYADPTGTAIQSPLNADDIYYRLQMNTDGNARIFKSSPGGAGPWIGYRVITDADLKYQIVELNGQEVIVLPPGRWCANDGIANGDRGYWFVEVVEFDSRYRTIIAHPYESGKRYYYFAKMVDGVWQGWEKYISAG